MFGVWAPGEDVAKLTYFGLYALQHRGQESAGIAVSNGRQILVYKDMGLVSQVFDESTLSQPGRPHRDRPLPLLDHRRQHLGERPADLPRRRHGGSIALGHNGNLINTHELKQMVETLPQEQDELDLHLRQARRDAPPTTPAWSPRCSPTTPTPRSSSARSRCCRSSRARSPSSG